MGPKKKKGVDIKKFIKNSYSLSKILKFISNKISYVTMNPKLLDVYMNRGLFNEPNPKIAISVNKFSNN